MTAAIKSNVQSAIIAARRGTSRADLRTACLAYGPLLALVGQRFYRLLLEDQDYPCVAFTRIWSPRMYTQSGDAGIAVARVPYDCWDKTDTGAFDLADKLIADVHSRGRNG